MREEPRFSEYGMTQWFWIARHHENLKLGKQVQIGSFTVLDCNYGMEIKDNVKIGYGCVIISYSSVDNKKGKIVIKENANIGANCVIMPNSIIGENATIGANSFVNKNVPAYEVWAGSPIKYIKMVEEKEEALNILKV